MEVRGLPETYRGIYLAYFEYGATGEGKTVEAQIVYGKEYAKHIKDPESQLKIGWQDLGWRDPFRPRLITATIEKEFHGAKYLDWNDEFKRRFYECFGHLAFQDFLLCCQNGATIDLIYKMHFNLS